MRVSLFILLVSIVGIIRAQIPQGLDMATQARLKKRGQACMRRHLPPSPYGQQLQQQLAICFNPNCGNAIIQQVMTAFPQYVPTLRQCLGY